MKTLKEYILEARNYVDTKLTKQFVTWAIEEMDSIVGKSYIHRELEKLGYEPDERSAVYQVISILHDNGKDVDYIYDYLSRIPEDRLRELVGYGANGFVFDKGDKVIKVYVGGRIKKDDEVFYKRCLSNEYKTFPKVYKVRNGIVVMEKLKTYTNKCKLFINILSKHQEWFSGRVGDVDKLSKSERYVLRWLQINKKEYDSLGVEYEWPGDLHLGNIGENESGNIIYFDI